MIKISEFNQKGKTRKNINQSKKRQSYKKHVADSVTRHTQLEHEFILA